MTQAMVSSCTHYLNVHVLLELRRQGGNAI